MKNEKLNLVVEILIVNPAHLQQLWTPQEAMDHWSSLSPQLILIFPLKDSNYLTFYLFY